MILNNSYWAFESVLTPKFCDEIIKYGTMQNEQLALTGIVGKDRDPKTITKKEEIDLKKKRDSNVVWMNDSWIYKEIHPYINTANKNAGWNFSWDWSESCQFTKYKLNQYYDWHVDAWNIPYENKNDLNLYGKIRKLSVTCSLSNPKDYEGGELEFSIPNKEPKEEEKIYTCKEILPKGSIVVFPSFVWHRVKPVTKGTRYSLVVWNLGYPYK